VGTVVGIAVTPVLCEVLAWPQALAAMSAVCLAPLAAFRPLLPVLSDLPTGADAKSEEGGQQNRERGSALPESRHEAALKASSSLDERVVGNQARAGRQTPPTMAPGSVAVGAAADPAQRVSSVQAGAEMTIKRKGGQRDVGAEADSGGVSTSGRGVDMDAWSAATGKMRDARDAGRSMDVSDGQRGARDASGGRWSTYLALAWAHSAIGWGFFTFSNWIPTIVRGLPGIGSGAVLGAASAAPWAATAAAAFALGPLFQALRGAGMGAFASQTAAHTAACLGAAAALLPLALHTSLSPAPALACMAACLALQTANYSGFHANVTTYGSGRTGAILGATNSCGIVAGLVANVVLAHTVSATGSYATMFGLTALVYASSWVLWMLCLRGEEIPAW
jgi:hypothetical protein